MKTILMTLVAALLMLAFVPQASAATVGCDTTDTDVECEVKVAFICYEMMFDLDDSGPSRIDQCNDFPRNVLP